MKVFDDMSALRSVILAGQHLDRKSSASVEDIVSDICGLQYDPNPTIHLNHYMMLWNRKQNFTIAELDAAAYRDFRLIETFAFKRNMFLVPCSEFAIYRAATKGIVRWGESDESWLAAADSPEDRAAEEELRRGLTGQPGMTTRQIWEHMQLGDIWNEHVKRRKTGDSSLSLPVFRAFYRMKRRTDLVTCGRNPGTFKEPLYILKENIGIQRWPNDGIGEAEAREYIIEKLVAALGVTYPVHISHITGIPTADVTPVFDRLMQRGSIAQLRVGRKVCFIHSSGARMLEHPAAPDCDEVRLISPMDTLVRDQIWLKTFFDYSYTFEYFKKKGMKWPLSILVGNRFVGYFDCRMEWRTGRFVIKEKNIFDPTLGAHRAIDLALQELVAFHGASDIVVQ